MVNPHWLFAWNVGAHLVASMSGIVSFAVSIYEAAKKKKFESWAFFAVGALCLIVAFDQAWQDEHRNSEVLTELRAAAVSERDFWKEQAYAKDSALYSCGQRLAQNYSTLIGEQTTANQTLQSLAQLSRKIIETNAVCYRPDRKLTEEQRRYLFAQLTRFAADVKKQGKDPVIIIAALSCDRESNAFAQVLREVFDPRGLDGKANAVTGRTENYRGSAEMVL